MEVTKEIIRKRFMALVDDNTHYSPDEHPSLEKAIDTLIERVEENLQVFAPLTQDMIDDQADNYNGYLDGAAVGDWVLGWDECWVSQLTVDGWLHHALSALEKTHNHINNISAFVENDIALDYLTEKNKA